MTPKRPLVLVNSAPPTFFSYFLLTYVVRPIVHLYSRRRRVSIQSAMCFATSQPSCASACCQSIEWYTLAVARALRTDRLHFHQIRSFAIGNMNFGTTFLGAIRLNTVRDQLTIDFHPVANATD